MKIMEAIMRMTDWALHDQIKEMMKHEDELPSLRWVKAILSLD